MEILVSPAWLADLDWMERRDHQVCRDPQVCQESTGYRERKETQDVVGYLAALVSQVCLVCQERKEIQDQLVCRA